MRVCVCVLLGVCVLHVCVCALLQGLLSFLSAPLIGALSDVWGRKSFLLLTVFFTCAPIPLMKISPWYVTALLPNTGLHLTWDTHCVCVCVCACVRGC